MEKIGLIICTTGAREEQLTRCLRCHRETAHTAGVEIVNRVLLDRSPSPVMRHLVAVRNRAVEMCEERWAFFCDDDDYPLVDHAPALLAARTNCPTATVIMGQARDAAGKVLGFSLSCSLVNIDRFRMVNWLCPSQGGEDFYTLSTLECRGHRIVKDSTLTWQVSNETPSLTREERVELLS